MKKYFKPASSDSSRTRIPIGTIDTTTVPPCGFNMIPKICDVRKSATPDLRDSYKLDTSIHGNLTNDLIVPPIFTDVLSDKISNNSSRDVYARLGMHFATDPVNSVTPQYVYLGFSSFDVLDKVTGLWTPATRVGRPIDFSRWSAPDHIFGETTAVGDAVSANSDYNYKTYF